MDFVADEFAEAPVNKLVPCKRALALEFGGDDECLEVSVVVAHDLDDRIVEALLYQMGDFRWVHTRFGPEETQGRAV